MDGMVAKKVEGGAWPKRYIDRWEEVPVPAGKQLKPGYKLIRMLIVEEVGPGVMAASWDAPRMFSKEQFVVKE